MWTLEKQAIVGAAIVILLILWSAYFAFGQPTGSNTVQAVRPTTTVASIGTTCTTAQRGQMLIVTDATAPTALATVAGAGAVTVGVTCNGTNWIVE